MQKNAILQQYATSDVLAARRSLYSYAIGPSLTDHIADHLQGFDGMSFLDVGCGFGADVEYFTARYAAVPAVGIDQSAGQIADAQAKIPHATFLVDDVGTFHLQRTFDRVLVRHVLHLVENPERAIENIFQHLAPNGRAIFVLHSTRSQPQLARWLAWFEEKTGITFTSPSDAFTVDHHAHLFNRPHMRTTVDDAVIHVRLQNPEPYITYIEGQKRWSRTPSAEEMTLLLDHVRKDIANEIASQGYFEEVSINGIITCV